MIFVLDETSCFSNNVIKTLHLINLIHLYNNFTVLHSHDRNEKIINFEFILDSYNFKSLCLQLLVEKSLQKVNA